MSALTVENVDITIQHQITNRNEKAQ